MKILAVGEIIFDIFNGESEIGGAPLNFCAHCSALGAQSAIVSGVGFDLLGDDALSRLKALGVNAEFVKRNNTPTGQCIVTVNNGNPKYDVLRPAAYDKIILTDRDVKNVAGFNADVFYFGTLIQRDSVSRKAVKEILKCRSFSEIFCDVNLRPGCYDRESCFFCLENATILKISAEEEPLLRNFGFYNSNIADTEKEIIFNICKAFDNIRIVVFTMGENGSLIYDKNADEYYRIPCDKVEVISTVGAGDSYSAAFICEYLKSGNVNAAANAGARLSAYVVSHREAIPEIKN